VAAAFWGVDRQPRMGLIFIFIFIIIIIIITGIVIIIIITNRGRVVSHHHSDAIGRP